MFKGIFCALAVVSSFGWAGAESVSRTIEVAPDSSAATVFAVPNGYRFVQASVSSGGVRLGNARSMNGVELVPITVTGATARASLTAEFASGAEPYRRAPSRLMRERLRALVANPEDVPLGKSATARTALSVAAPTAAGELGTAPADVLILAPSALYPEWQAYAAMRSAQSGLVCEAVNTFDIYTNAAYRLDTATTSVSNNVRNHAEALHKYLRTMVGEKGFSYVILGGSWIDAQALDDAGNWTDDQGAIRTFADGTAMNLTNAVPGVYAHPTVAEASDMFYACLELVNGQKYPWCAGDDEDYYDFDRGEESYDSGVDVIVARVPLKPMTVNDHCYTAHELFEAFTNKLVRAETSFHGKGRIGNGWTTNDYSTHYVDGRYPDELEFYDDAPNFFAEDRNEQFDDVEVVQRPKIPLHLARHRPVIAVDTLNGYTWTRGYATHEAAVAAFYAKDHDYASTDSHGYSGGGGDFDNARVRGATGLTKLIDMSIPCDSGQQVSAEPCFGESSVDAPFGGSLATVANSHNGIVSSYNIVLSDNAYSYRMLHDTTRGFLDLGYDAGFTWLEAHFDYFKSTSWYYADERVLVEHTLFGDPLVRAELPDDGDGAEGVFPEFATNLTTSASSFAVTGSNAVINVRHGAVTETLTFAKAAGSEVARMKVMNAVDSFANAVVFDGVEGGVGGSVNFGATTEGTLVITNATGRFYLGGVTNAARLAVYGKNVVLNADGFDRAHLKSLTLVAPEGGTNTLRGINADALAGVAITAVGGTVKLESEDLFNRNAFALDGATVILGVDPALGPRAVSPEPIDVVFSGTGTLVYPHGSRTTLSFTTTEDCALTEDETPLVTAFTLEGLSNGPAGWFSNWGGEGFDATGVLAPDGFAHTVKAGVSPWYPLVPKTTRTFALYADLTDVSTATNNVMMSLGTSVGDDQLLLVCGGADKLISLVTVSGDGVSVAERLTAAYPGDGYHLYIVQLLQGVPSLQIDDRAIESGTRAIATAAGWQVGDQYGSAKGAYGKAIGMAVAAIRGYDAVLGESDRARLVEEFPAFPRPFAFNTSPNLDAGGTTIVMSSCAFTNNNFFSMARGTYEIPEGVTVDTTGVELMTGAYENYTGGIDVHGTLNVTGAEDAANVWFNSWYYGSHAGVLGGFWAGAGTVNIYGTMNAASSYWQMKASSYAQQTINVDGGYLKVLGISAYSDNNRILVQNGGVLEVACWPTWTYCAGAIDIVLKGGTLRACGDWGNLRDLALSGSNTLDTAGHSLTLTGALSGDGTLVITDSTASGVSYVSTSALDLSNFTGRIVNALTVGNVSGCVTNAVLSINVALTGDHNVSAAESKMNPCGTDTQAALCAVPGLSWNDLTLGTSTSTLRAWTGYAAADLTGATVTLSGKNDWGYLSEGTSGSAPAAFLGGYLDDGGSRAQITVTGVPYATYDLIVYAATDSGDARFSPVEINGKYYIQTSATDVATQVADGTNYSWGASRATSAALATNALRLNGLSGDLAIVGGANQTVAGVTCRGGIAAVQVIKRDASPEDEPAEEWTVYSSTTTIYPSDSNAMKIRVANGATLTIGHSGSGDSYNLPTDSSISIDAGAQVLFSYWSNGSQQGAAKVGNVSITGTGTFGYDSVNSYPMTMGTVTGTAILVIDDGETVTADSIENPVSLTGSATLKVLTAGAQPTLFTIPDGYHKVVTTEGDYTVYTIEKDVEAESDGGVLFAQGFVADTETTDLPDGWNQHEYKDTTETACFKLGANGATVNRSWKQNALDTAITLKPTTSYVIDIETYSSVTDCEAVVYLSSEYYSVCLGNSYNSNAQVYVGYLDRAVTNCFVTFQSGTGSNPTVGQTIDTVDVGGGLAYHLVLSGTSLTGTVSDGTNTAAIDYALSKACTFTSIGLMLDGSEGQVGLKALRIEEHPAKACWAAANSGDWYGEISNTNHIFYSTAGDMISYLTGDTVVITNDLQLYAKTAAQGAMFQIGTTNAAATVYFTRSGNDCNDYVLSNSTVTVESGSQLVFQRYDIANNWDSYQNANPDQTSVTETTITGEGEVLVASNVALVVSSSTTIESAIKLAYGATLTVLADCEVSVPTTDLEGYEVVADGADPVTYSLKANTPDEPKTVYVKDAAFTSFVDADGNTVTLGEEDTIVVDSHYEGGQWNCAPDDSVAGHKIVWSLTQGNLKNFPDDVELEISSGCVVFLWCDIGEGATITGEGTLSNAFNDASGRTIGDGATISCAHFLVGNVVMTVNGAVTITSADFELAGSMSLAVGATFTTTTTLADGQVKGATGARLVTTTDGSGNTVYTVSTICYDENHIEPYHWYRFDGDNANYGYASFSANDNTPSIYCTGATNGTENAFNLAEGTTNQRMWGTSSGFTVGTGDWTINLVGKMPSDENGALFSFGSATHGTKYQTVSLVSQGSTNPGVKVIGNGSGDAALSLTASIDDAVTAFHAYALTYTAETQTYALYVDGDLKDSATSTIAPEEGFYQFGNIHGYNGETYKADDGVVDDFRVYHQALTAKDLGFTAVHFGLVDVKTLAPHTFAIGTDGNFKLDGTNFLIRCAEMHFARIPRAYWELRIQQAKACGFNAVCAYMFWNNHEPEKGYWRFSGEQDVAEFCRLAQKNGMWVILRPGPYTCAEWEYGGFPWWFRKENVSVRTNTELYMKYSQIYLNRVFEEVGELQITRGGPILMVQVENEYGFFGSSTDYMRACYNSTAAAGFSVPKFTCAPKNYLSSGYIPELFPVINGGSGFFGSDGGFETLTNLRKGTQWEGAPLMVGEYYPAWYDSWGNAHQVKDTATCVADLVGFCTNNASFSVYMAHGGTSFGWGAGFNEATQVMTPSYDYNAPITEAGHYNEKFWAFKEVLDQYTNAFETVVASNDVPAEIAMQTATIATNGAMYANFWDMPDETFTLVTNDTNALTFELADLGYGYMLYETTIPAGLGGKMTATVKDLGVVRIDGEEVGYFDYRYKNVGIVVQAAEKDRRLQIFVEAFGRSHFYLKRDVDNGIQTEVKIGDTKLENWTMKTFNIIEHKTAMSNVVYSTEIPATGRSASLYKYTVNLEYGKDTFLDMHDWKRGMVCLNGHWLGHYWSIGPQQDLYVPGCWLNESGENEIDIIDMIGVEPPSELKFIDTHVLDDLRSDTDYFYVAPAHPDVPEDYLETPVSTGTLAQDRAEQTNTFAAVKGRYFAIKATSSYSTTYTACAELNVLDADGNKIDRSNWTIVACSSEEQLGETAVAERMIDGDTSTFWHTEWKKVQSTLPQSVVIDMGATNTVTGFTWMGRQDSSAILLKGYEVYVLNYAPGEEPPPTEPVVLTEGGYTDAEITALVATAGTNAVIIAGGTYENPVVVTNTSDSVKKVQFLVQSNGVLKVYFDGGNKTILVSGEGPTSTLVVASSKDWGIDDGSAIRDITLIVDDPSHKFWIENRTPVAAFDGSVDVVLTNASPAVISGGSVTIGSLSGDGTVTKNGSGALVVADPLKSDFTGTNSMGDGTFKVMAGTNDVTSACTNFKLDAEKSWTSGDGEAIPVTPTLSDATDEIVPLEIEEDAVAVGVKTIPGLTYHLDRYGSVADAGATENADTVDHKTAGDTRTQLKDETEKPDKAFYRVRVTK